MFLKNIKPKKAIAEQDAPSAAPHWSDGLYTASEAIPLEPRIMLDGAAPAVLVDVMDTQHTFAANADVNHNSEHFAVAPLVTSTAEESLRHEVVIIDSSVEGYDLLLADLIGESGQIFWQTSESGIESFVVEQHDRAVSIYAISDGHNGLYHISNILESYTQVDAVHILTHGNSDGILINDHQVDLAALEADSAAITTWSNSLSDDGDILLYGCYVGANGANIGFIQTLSSLTGADVAASDDLTGHRDLGGDWELEVATGPIESELVTQLDVQAGFSGVLAALPTTTLDVPAESFINENFEFCVIVDNAGVDTGYEPILSLFLEPGIDVNGASFLGASLNVSEYTWDAVSLFWFDSSGDPLTEHPQNPDLPLPSTPSIDGTTWILVDLPFGSVVPSQPPAKIDIDATLDPVLGAEVGVPLDISAQTVFALGEDPMNNAAIDPPVFGPLEGTSITPTILLVEKESDNSGDNAVGVESEQATGPNSPITFELRVDVADGQTVDNVLLSDLVPNDVHYLGSLTVAGSGTLVNIGTSDATIGVHNGNQLTVSFDSVTGTLGDDDILITYQGYIPDLDATGQPILDPVSGGGVDLVENTVDVTGDHGAIPVSATDTDDITPGALKIQKTVDILDSSGSPFARNTVLPGEILEWTLRFQVSDYFSLDAFEITDTFGDGQLYIAGSETVEIFENGNSTGPSPIAAGNVNLGVISPATGLTQVTYDMASIIAAEVASSVNGELHGDLVDTVQTGKTKVHVTFRTEVQENFQFPGVFGGDASVDVGDVLTNTASVTAEVFGTDNVVTDASAANVEVAIPSSSKSIYAIDLDTDGWDAADPEIAPGQNMTYRITVELPTTDVENLVITDFLPLPIFAAAPSYAYTGFYSGFDMVPAPGEYGFGPLTDPADFPPNFFNATGTSLDSATVSVDVAANSLTWNFGEFDQVGSSGGTIDLLFTTATADVPFADGLKFTNQALISYDNTNNPQAPLASIVQFEPIAPALQLTKGVVAVDVDSIGTFAPTSVGPATFSDAGTAGPAFSGSVTSANLDTSPIDSDVSGLDAGDIVRYAITIENTGTFQRYQLLSGG